jgi:hypothetical protein
MENCNSGSVTMTKIYPVIYKTSSKFPDISPNFDLSSCFHNAFRPFRLYLYEQNPNWRPDGTSFTTCPHRPCLTILRWTSKGWYLPEAAHPYYILAPHAKIDFASPAGPNPPVDDYSVKSYTKDEDTKDEECVKFLNDDAVNAKFADAKKLSDVSAKDYDAIFYVGGHGPSLDLASDPVNAKLASEASTMRSELPDTHMLTDSLFTVLAERKDCLRRLPRSGVRIIRS